MLIETNRLTEWVLECDICHCTIPLTERFSHPYDDTNPKGYNPDVHFCMPCALLLEYRYKTTNKGRLCSTLHCTESELSRWLKRLSEKGKCRIRDGEVTFYSL